MTDEVVVAQLPSLNKIITTGVNLMADNAASWTMNTSISALNLDNDWCPSKSSKQRSQEVVRFLVCLYCGSIAKWMAWGRKIKQPSRAVASIQPAPLPLFFHFEWIQYETLITARAWDRHFEKKINLQLELFLIKSINMHLLVLWLAVCVSLCNRCVLGSASEMTQELCFHLLLPAEDSVAQ